MQKETSPDYYAQPGRLTDPGPYADLFEPLPTDLSALCTTLHGLLAIDFWVDSGALQVPPARRQEVNLRSVPDKLHRLLELDNRPLTAARPFELRLLGNCRDLSLLLCAVLRYQGVPARLRSGFATFFDPHRRFDHWVCEYWAPETQRWVSVDAWMSQIHHEQERLSPQLRAGLQGLDLQPLDVQPEYFLTGGQAWQRCREGGEDPECYGTYGDLQGLWFTRDNLLRDLLSLNKLEVLPWDCWGMIAGRHHPPNSPELPLLDKIAALTRDCDASFAEIRSCYAQNPSLHPPAELPD